MKANPELRKAVLLYEPINLIELKKYFKTIDMTFDNRVSFPITALSELILLKFEDFVYRALHFILGPDCVLGLTLHHVPHDKTHKRIKYKFCLNLSNSYIVILFFVRIAFHQSTMLKENINLKI